MLNGTEMKISSKLSRLHDKYGMFVRFEGGNEEDNPDAVAKAIEEAEEAELENNAVFTKQKQQSQQHEANARKATERASQAESAVEASKAETESLKTQLAEAIAKADTAGVKDVELDLSKYEDDDVPIVQAVQTLQKQVKAANDANAILAKKAKDYEADEASKESKRQIDAAYSDMLNDLDGEYGPENRNAAVAMYNELSSQGKTPKGEPAKAGIEMARCYKKAKAAAEKNPEKKKVPGDPGVGGGSPISLKTKDIGTGSLDDVADDFKKAGLTAKPEDY